MVHIQPPYFRTRSAAPAADATWVNPFTPKLIKYISQPLKEKCINEIIFHLSTLRKPKLFILRNVIVLVRLQGKFESERVHKSKKWKLCQFSIFERLTRNGGATTQSETEHWTVWWNSSSSDRKCNQFLLLALSREFSPLQDIGPG